MIVATTRACSWSTNPLFSPPQLLATDTFICDIQYTFSNSEGPDLKSVIFVWIQLDASAGSVDVPSLDEYALLRLCKPPFVTTFSGAGREQRNKKG